MTSKQDAKYAMYLAVKSVCDRYASVYEDHEAFHDLYSQWTGRVANIRALGQIKASRNKGVAQDKHRLRLEMCDAALEIASAARAFAVATKNRELAARVDFSRSDLLSGRDVDSAENCANIHAAATTHLTAIKPYGVTAAKLTALKDKIDAYSASLPSPRVSIVAGKSATRNLVAEFKAADELLKEGLDNLVRQFKDEEPAFVADYFSARTIVDNASRSENGASAASVTSVSQPQSKAA
jgi:hypothetical protein